MIDPTQPPVDYANQPTIQVPVRVSIQEWSIEHYPDPETHLHDLGLKLFELVSNKSFMGPLPLEAWLFGGDAIQQVQFRTPPSQHLLASMCGMSGVQHIAVLGELKKMEQGRLSRLAHVFIEDQQGRWWFGAQGLDDNGAVLFPEPAVSSIIEGGKPLGIGGWFAMSRRLGLQGHFSGWNEN